MSTITRVYYELVARDSASRTFRKVGDESAFAESRVARLGRAFAAVGGAVTIAGAAVAVESIRMSTSFQAAMTKVQTQAGASAQDVKLLSDQILRLASSHAQQAPIDLANAMYHLKSVGLDNVHAMKALRQASDLAAVGGANLEETTTALAGAWRSGIKGAQSFGQSAATVNAIIGAGNMRMQDFIDAIGTGILPAARTFGVSLSSVGSALALMTDEGIPASDAATRLRMTLSLIGAPSNKAAAELKTIGLSSTALANAMRSPGGLVAAVQMLKDHLDKSGLSATDAAAVISHAFGGGRSSAAIMTLLNNVDVLRRKQDQVNASIGKFGPAVAAQQKTAAAAFARLRTEVDVIGIRIGNALLPPVVAFASFLANTVIPGIVNVARTVRRELSPVLNPLDQFIHTLFGDGGKPAPPAPGRFTFGHGSHANPVTPLPIPAPGHFLSGHGSHARQGLENLIPAKPSPAMGQRLGAMLGTALMDAIIWLGSHAAKWTGALVKVLSSLDWVDIGKQVGGNAIGFALGFISNIGADLFTVDFWKKHWLDVIIGVLSLVGIGKLAGPLEKIISHIPILKIFSPLLKGIEKIGAPIFDKGVAVMKSLLRGILDGIEHVLPDAYKAVFDWLLKLSYQVARFAGRLANAARSFIGGLNSGILSMARSVGRVIGTAIGWLLKPFVKAGSWLVSSGSDLVRGLLRGIRSFMSGIGSWVKGNIVDPLVNAVKHFFGIKSPSTVMAGIGGNLIKGLMRGLASHNPLQIARHIFGGLPQALGHIVSKGLAVIGSLPGRALRALRGLGGGILDLLGLGGGDTGARSGSAAVAQRYAASILPRGWSMSDLIKLWNQESGWNSYAVNPSSGAYGIPQSLGHGHPYNLGDYKAQIIWGLNYIASRYGSSQAAWAHEQAVSWYGKGLNAIFNRPTVIGVGERGAEKVTVTPLGRGRGRGEGPLIVIENFNPTERADLDLLASKIVFGLGV